MKKIIASVLACLAIVGCSDETTYRSVFELIPAEVVSYNETRNRYGSFQIKSILKNVETKEVYSISDWCRSSVGLNRGDKVDLLKTTKTVITDSGISKTSVSYEVCY